MTLRSSHAPPATDGPVDAVPERWSTMLAVVTSVHAPSAASMMALLAAWPSFVSKFASASRTGCPLSGWNQRPGGVPSKVNRADVGVAAVSCALLTALPGSFIAWTVAMTSSRRRVSPVGAICTARGEPSAAIVTR